MKKHFFLMMFVLIFFASMAHAESKTFAWDAPANAVEAQVQGYTMYIAEGTNYYNKTVMGNVLEMTIDNLAPGKTYQFGVRAFNEIGESEPSNIVTYTPAAGWLPPVDKLLPEFVEPPQASAATGLGVK